MPKPVGGSHLSNTYRSDRIITPLAPSRHTTSKYSYNQSAASYLGGSVMKWGRGEDYGLHIGDGDSADIKGHRHFSSGFEYRPEDVPMTTLVDVTMLKKSNTRPRDHLVLEPQKVNLADSQITLPFPRNHTYFSHLSAKDIFPQHKPPSKHAAVLEEQIEDAQDSDDEYDVAPVLAYDREFKPDLRSSTKGCPWRTETINSDWRPAPVPRTEDQRVTAETFNNHKTHAKKLKESHYTRIHGGAVAPKNFTAKPLAEYTPSWRHEILKQFNERHGESLPDIRKPGNQKRHVFYGVNVMSIEHG